MPDPALEVRGDSMIDAHIVDGDFVIMEIQGVFRALLRVDKRRL
jgi:SOS-response transcriptional repressor LexA